MAGEVKQFKKQRSQQEEQRQGQGPDRGCFSCRHGQKDDSNDILHDQDTHGCCSVQGVQFTAILQNLDGKDGTGKGKGKANQDRGTDRYPAQQRCKGKQENHTAQYRRGDQHVQAGAQPDLPAQQAFDIKLQTDGEKQQGDTKISQFLQCFPGLANSQVVEQETRSQKTDQGRQLEQSGNKAAEKGKRNPGSVNKPDGSSIHRKDRFQVSAISGQLTQTATERRRGLRDNMLITTTLSFLRPCGKKVVQVAIECSTYRICSRNKMVRSWVGFSKK